MPAKQFQSRQHRLPGLFLYISQLRDKISQRICRHPLGVQDPTNLDLQVRKMNVRLIKLTKEYHPQLVEMIDEWKLDHELNHTNHSPWAIFRNDHRDIDHYLEDLEISGPEDGKVPNSVFFLLDIERDILLGAVDIRHYLNDHLLKHGGHIGDGIRPSERGKGYGTEMIRLSLLECRKLGIDRVLMVCDRSNIASAKTIIKNGGILENEIVGDDGRIEQRYWINLGQQLPIG